MTISMIIFLFIGAVNACNVDECQAVWYQDCKAEEGCGDGCEYLPDGIGDSGCAWNQWGTATGEGWHAMGGGVDAIDVSGGCTFQIARGDVPNVDPFEMVYAPGFHGLWKTYDSNGVHLGDAATAIKMSCDTAYTVPAGL